LKLSIIIVNYNVEHFLEQCLTSVFKAIKNIDAEIFVVDNNSADGSVKMVREKFPTVELIENKDNPGFSKANNQAIKLSKGEYVLLLNPDTVVEEDTFEKCISFSDDHSDLGGLGVKMIDGNGIFLPESKRGLPTPLVSFFKISGLSNLFPKSKLFAKYHLGYLKVDDINEIDILSGAFMWMRKTVLEEIGYLDETFFMYGEDIDMSYRIIKAGYKNYYFPKSKIIHYKGESTKKGSINYVFVFYNAMIIFSKKHFAKKAKAFAFFINIAIYLRAFLAISMRFIRQIRLPIIDIALILTSLLILNSLKPFLGFPNQIALINDYHLLNVFAVCSTFLIGLGISGGYSKSISINKTLIGLLIGTILLLGVNFVFPPSFSFSNKYLISINIGIFILVPFSRIILNYFNKLKLKKNKNKTTIIAGGINFVEGIQNSILAKKPDSELLSLKKDNTNSEEKFNYIGKLYQLPDLIDIYNVNEVIFSSTDIKYKDIIHEMSLNNNKYVDYKIVLNKLIISAQTIEKTN
jgi:GT2 family glycosyltransferase